MRNPSEQSIQEGFLAALGMTLRVSLRPQAQIAPLRISSLDQAHFLHAAPTLNLFLPHNGSTDTGMWFTPDQPVHVVALGKAGDHTFLVLSYASHEIICHPDIQHTRIAGHDVGTKCSRPCHVRFRPFSANAPQPVIPNGVCGVRNLSVRSIREGFLAALGMTGRSRLSHSKAWSPRLPAVGRPTFRLASGTTRSPPLSLIRHDDSVIHLTTLAGHDRPANSLLCRLAMSARRHFGVRRPCRRFCDWRSRARLVCGSPAPAGRARFTNRHGERWALALQTGRRIPHFGRHVCLFWSARRPKLTSLRRPVRKSLRWS